MRYTLTAEAIRQIKTLPPAVRKQIFAKIEGFVSTGAGHVKSLKGSDAYRLRSGDYRVIFLRESDGSITVTAVGNRRDIYD